MFVIKKKLPLKPVSSEGGVRKTNAAVPKSNNHMEIWTAGIRYFDL